MDRNALINDQILEMIGFTKNTLSWEWGSYTKDNNEVRSYEPILVYRDNVVSCNVIKKDTTLALNTRVTTGGDIDKIVDAVSLLMGACG